MSDLSKIRVRLDQLVPIKEAVRTLPDLVRRLNAGDGPFLLTKRGEPVAVLMTLDALRTDSEGQG
jgi:prevent-host-death family protein